MDVTRKAGYEAEQLAPFQRENERPEQESGREKEEVFFHEGWGSSVERIRKGRKTGTERRALRDKSLRQWKVKKSEEYLEGDHERRVIGNNDWRRTGGSGGQEKKKSTSSSVGTEKKIWGFCNTNAEIRLPRGGGARIILEQSNVIGRVGEGKMKKLRH